MAGRLVILMDLNAGQPTTGKSYKVSCADLTTAAQDHDARAIDCQHGFVVKRIGEAPVTIVKTFNGY